MTDFKSPQLSDKKWVDSYLNIDENMNCELCFGNLYIWSEIYDNHIIEHDDFFIVRNSEEFSNVYSLPIGSGNLKKALEFIIADAGSENKNCKIYGLSDSQIRLLNETMPNKFEFFSDRGNYDYIYSVDKLAALAGKKYHSKRNHINKFNALYPDWTYEKLSKSNVSQCVDMHRKWIEEAIANESDDASVSELTAVGKGLSNFEELGVSGGLLRVDGEVAAYTFGDRINDNLFCTHIEKAFHNIDGAYPLINQQFAINNLSSYKLVNREEDLGIDGLRKAKMSYQPEILLKKATAVYGG